MITREHFLRIDGEIDPSLAQRFQTLLRVEGDPHSYKRKYINGFRQALAYLH